MKVTHRIPTQELHSAVLDERYAREVEAATNRGERDFKRAVQRLRAAERRVARLETEKPTKRTRKELSVALELLEIRRAELAQISDLMTGIPASSVHRSRALVRPVPEQGRII